jgi:hypothetical protein
MNTNKILSKEKRRFMQGHSAGLTDRPRKPDEQELILTVMRLLPFASIRVSYSCPLAVSVRGEKGGSGLADRGREGF